MYQDSTKELNIGEINFSLIKKNNYYFEKNLQKIWWNENNSLTL